MTEPRTITVIFNPSAGAGRFRVDENRLLSAIKKRSYDLKVPVDLNVLETKRKGDCQELAMEASENGTDVVAVAGGDGTILEAVNSLVGKKTALGIIPIGSGNDDIVSISGHNDMERCIDDMIIRRIRSLDVGRMNDTYFLNVVGLGLDAEVNHLVSRKRDRVKTLGPALTYTTAAVKVLSSFKPYHISVDLDGRDMGEITVSLCTIGNGTTCGGGYRLTPEALMDDGRLDLSISGYIGTIRSVLNIRRAFKGEHVNRPENRYCRFTRCRISGVNRELPYHMDGEAGFADQVELNVIPGGINTVHPPPDHE